MLSVCCCCFSAPHRPSAQIHLASLVSVPRGSASQSCGDTEEETSLTWSGTPLQEGTFVQGQPLQEVTFELRLEGGASHAKIWWKSGLGKGKGPEVEASLVPLGKGREQCDGRKINKLVGLHGDQAGNLVLF